MRINIIVAAAKNGGIGLDGDLLWRLPKDMQFFKKTTTGHAVLMGRKTWESIPERFRPLPDRTNIVITRSREFKDEDCLTARSIEAGIALAKQQEQEELFIIGGGMVYLMSMLYADRIYLSLVDAELEADTFFDLPGSSEWDLVSVEHHKKDARHAYDFDIQILDRKK